MFAAYSIMFLSLILFLFKNVILSVIFNLTYSDRSANALYSSLKINELIRSFARGHLNSLVRWFIQAAK